MPHPWRGGAASDSDLLESSASDILSDSFTYRRAYTRLVDVGLPIYEEQNIGYVITHTGSRASHKDVSHKFSCLLETLAFFVHRNIKDARNSSIDIFIAFSREQKTIVHPFDEFSDPCRSILSCLVLKYYRDVLIYKY